MTNVAIGAASPSRSAPLRHSRLGRGGRTLHALSQSARIAWFLGQYRLAARRVGPTLSGLDIPPGMPTQRDVMVRIAALIQRDRDNIDAGLYGMPEDWMPRLGPALRMGRRFLADLDRVSRRRREGRGQEVFEAGGRERHGYPRYYLQNFHYQTDGWLSDESASLYDYQVEVLFYGTAAAMRRQGLVPVDEYIRSSGRRIADLRLLDVACGTGRFLDAVKSNWPRLPAIGLDLSPNYLQRARADLSRRSWLSFVNAPAEAMPLPDGSIDIATCVYLFHELPHGVRNRVAQEVARVLRPGGRFVFIDSLQNGDDPPLDPLLEFFPRAYHEPYFRDYVRTDLSALFERAGLRRSDSAIALFSKILVFDKPA